MSFGLFGGQAQGLHCVFAFLDPLYMAIKNTVVWHLISCCKQQQQTGQDVSEAAENEQIVGALWQ